MSVCLYIQNIHFVQERVYLNKVALCLLRYPRLSENYIATLVFGSMTSRVKDICCQIISVIYTKVANII